MGQVNQVVASRVLKLIYVMNGTRIEHRPTTSSIIRFGEHILASSEKLHPSITGGKRVYGIFPVLRNYKSSKRVPLWGRLRH